MSRYKRRELEYEFTKAKSSHFRSIDRLIRSL